MLSSYSASCSPAPDKSVERDGASSCSTGKVRQTAYIHDEALGATTYFQQNRSFLLSLDALIKGNVNAGASDPWTCPQPHIVPSGDQLYASSFQQTVIGGTSDDSSHFPVTEPISGSQYKLNLAVRMPPDFSFEPVPSMPNACDGSTAGSFSHDPKQVYAGPDAIGHGAFPFPDPN